jgi:flavin-dependent dehydrogenase
VGVGGLEGGAFLEKNLEKVIKILGIEKKIERREFPGYGLVPLGRPLPSMVYPGLLVCGDAASQVNPLTGGGIAPAVKAGYLAAITSAEAVENNDVSTKGMWDYNCGFAREYGAKHAALVIARDFLVSLSDEELNYFLENIVTGEDLSQLMEGRVSFQERDMWKIFYDHWRKPSLLYRTYRAFKQMIEIRDHYSHYPRRPEEFSAWRETLDQYVDPHNRKGFTLPS